MYGTASAGPGYINLSDMIDKEFVIPAEDYAPGRFVVRVEGNSMTRIVKNLIEKESVSRSTKYSK